MLAPHTYADLEKRNKGKAKPFYGTDKQGRTMKPPIYIPHKGTLKRK